MQVEDEALKKEVLDQIKLYNGILKECSAKKKLAEIALEQLILKEEKSK